CASPGYW
nr:immunoglobulin heavy chain junction region [Mus musculus]